MSSKRSFTDRTYSLDMKAPLPTCDSIGEARVCPIEVENGVDYVPVRASARCAGYPGGVAVGALIAVQDVSDLREFTSAIGIGKTRALQLAREALFAHCQTCTLA